MDRFVCHRCRMGFRVEKPTRDDAEFYRCPEVRCGLTFWSVQNGSRRGNAIIVGIDPIGLPSEAEWGSELERAPAA